MNLSLHSLSLLFSLDPSPVLCNKGQQYLQVSRAHIKNSYASFVRHSASFSIKSSRFSCFLNSVIFDETSAKQVISTTQYYSTSKVIQDCLFVNVTNSNLEEGGGMHILAKSATIVVQDCQFLSCISDLGGGFSIGGDNVVTIKRNCFLECGSPRPGSAFRIAGAGSTHISDVTTFQCGLKNTLSNEAIVISNGFLDVVSLNSTWNINFNTVGAILLWKGRSLESSIRFSTIASHVSDSIIGLRDTTNISGVVLDHINVFNNTYGNRGLINLQTSHGHIIRDSRFSHNMGTYMVGWRDDYGKGTVTFITCHFDASVTTLDAVAITQDCALLPRVITHTMTLYTDELCSKPSDSFTSSNIKVSSLTVLLASLIISS